MTPHQGTIINIARLLRSSASALAASIDDEMQALTPEMRNDLRKLPMDMDRWADAIDPASAPYDDEHELMLREQGAAPLRRVPVRQVVPEALSGNVVRLEVRT